ncbi:hypothetical protein [Methylogaea oryzae]|uniref:Uncharacterized protein n=1 Tax=Methylogaea oryzae TaxID=1295382 RepID=A0A8D4VPB1_9GAMM|nr:hypothetical protein [Methylogaea oryzae]BBL70015.1 hypothetical protein MoryE10_06210 [Methylogaea oryzae]
MLLTVLEVAFGLVFVLGVITQLIWPLLTDKPLFPGLGQRHKRRRPAARQAEKTVDGQVVAIEKPRQETES